MLYVILKLFISGIQPCNPDLKIIIQFTMQFIYYLFIIFIYLFIYWIATCNSSLFGNKASFYYKLQEPVGPCCIIIFKLELHCCILENDIQHDLCLHENVLRHPIWIFLKIKLWEDVVPDSLALLKSGLQCWVLLLKGFKMKYMRTYSYI
jgi:hypothetical protein